MKKLLTVSAVLISTVCALDLGTGVGISAPAPTAPLPWPANVSAGERPLPDRYLKEVTDDGWELHVEKKNEKVNIAPPLDSSVTTGETFGSLKAKTWITGNGKPELTGALFETGYQVGCGVDMSSGVDYDVAGTVGVAPRVSAGVEGGGAVSDGIEGGPSVSAGKEKTDHVGGAVEGKPQASVGVEGKPSINLGAEAGPTISISLPSGSIDIGAEGKGKGDAGVEGGVKGDAGAEGTIKGDAARDTSRKVAGGADVTSKAERSADMTGTASGGVDGKAELSPRIKGKLVPGKVSKVVLVSRPVDREFKRASAGFTGAHIQINGCAGPVTVRSFVSLSTSSPTSVDSVSVYGDPQRIR